MANDSCWFVTKNCFHTTWSVILFKYTFVLQTWVFLRLNPKIQIQIQIQTFFHRTVLSRNFDRENSKNQIRPSSSAYSCVKIRWCSSFFLYMMIFNTHFQHWNTRSLSISPPTINNFLCSSADIFFSHLDSSFCRLWENSASIPAFQPISNLGF